MVERLAQYFSLYSWLFWTTVERDLNGREASGSQCLGLNGIRPKIIKARGRWGEWRLVGGGGLAVVIKWWIWKIMAACWYSLYGISFNVSMHLYLNIECYVLLSIRLSDRPMLFSKNKNSDFWRWDICKHLNDNNNDEVVSDILYPAVLVLRSMGERLVITPMWFKAEQLRCKWILNGQKESL